MVMRFVHTAVAEFAVGQHLAEQPLLGQFGIREGGVVGHDPGQQPY